MAEAFYMGKNLCMVSGAGGADAGALTGRAHGHGVVVGQTSLTVAGGLSMQALALVSGQLAAAVQLDHDAQAYADGAG
uniref:hypothetical protein n=1 Tax=Corynebacterium variabile TaxID=1727 RepID=UPI002FE164AE